MTKSIVLELQKELLDNAAPLSQLIIKAWVVAKKLKLEDDAAQFRKEFDGYSDYEKVPDYRHVKGKLQRCSFSTWKDVDKDGRSISDNFKSSNNTPAVNISFTIRKSIRNLEKKLQGVDDVTEMIKFYDVPYEITKDRSFYDKERDQYRCVYSPAIHSDILHEIKIKLIEWTMSLSENGILGNDMSFEEDEKEMAKQIIHAGGNVVLQNYPNNSPQTVSFNTNQLEIFDKLLKAVEAIENNEEMIKSIENMRESVSQQDGSFKTAYNKFMEAAANHMTVLLPFIQELTKFF